MTNIQTQSGFSCIVDETKLDDMELLDDLIAIDAGDLLAFPRVTSRLLGVEDKKRLYDHIRTEDGRVPTEAFGRELAEIIKGLESKKK